MNIDPEAWEGYVQMRKKIKKPMTVGAEKRAKKTLELLHSQGEDINLVLNQSEDNCWRGLFKVNEGYYGERGIQRGNAQMGVAVERLTDRSWSE